MTDDNINGIPRTEARARIRDAKAGLAKHSRRLYQWATEDLSEDPPMDDLLRQCMASVLLAEVNLGTDDEPNFTTRLVQILRLLIETFDHETLVIDSPRLTELIARAKKVLVEQD